MTADVEWMLRLPPTDEGETATCDFGSWGGSLGCEQVREEEFPLGIVLQSHESKCLPKEEAAKFGAVLDEISAIIKKAQGRAREVANRLILYWQNVG